MVALVQKEIIIIIPEILFNTEYIAFSVFPFILPILPLQNYILFNLNQILFNVSPQAIQRLTTTDLPDQTDNYISCLRTIWTPRTIRTILAIRVHIFICEIISVFPIFFRFFRCEYNTTTDHSDQTDLSLSSLVPWSLIMFFCLKQLYVLLLLCLILSSLVC